MRRTAARQIRILLVCAVLAPAGCGDTDSAPPQPSRAAACTLRIAPDPAYDVVLTGSAACPGTVRLGLRVATGDASAPQWSAAAQASLQVEGAWQIAASGATRSVTVSNPGNTPVSFIGLEWSATDMGLVADRMLHNGYQGSSYTGIEPIQNVIPEAHGTVAHAGDDENSQGEISGISWWVTALADMEARGVVIGADGGTVLKTYIGTDGGTAGTRLRLVMGVTGDAIVLAPGERRRLDGLFISLGDVRAGLDAYAQHVASLHPHVGPHHAPLGGWGSWNLYYLFLNANGIRQEMAWAHEHLVPLGLTDFLLDDGYEPYWGQWKSSSHFGADLTTLAGEQMGLALRPEVWVAPMYLGTQDPVVAQHPEWFVHDPDGQMRVYVQIGARRYATLDIAQPDARNFIVNQLQGLWAAGYRSFKLDFLLAAAIEGVHQTAMTALESYQMWMQLLRATLPEAHLVGAGAPLLPSVGWVDSMRTGSDIAFSGVGQQTPHYGYYAAEARQTALRSWSDAWWAIDPDVILLRGTDITDVDAWSSVVAGALAGGNYLLGDGRQAGDLRDALALDPEVLALRDGVAARPLDLMRETDDHLTPIPADDPQGQTAVPHLWMKTSADGQRHWLAVFAWRAEPYTTEVDLPLTAVEILPPAAAGTTSTTHPIAGHQSIEVSDHAVRLFRW